MVLLVSANPEMSVLSSTITELVGEQVEIVNSLAKATNRLRRQEYSLVLVDQGMAEAGTAEADTLLRHIHSAAILFVNLAIAGPERIRSEVQLAFRRRQAESDAAREASMAALSGEVREPLSAIILLAELALHHSEMSPQLRETLEQITHLANDINDRLHKPAAAAQSARREDYQQLPS